MVTTVLRIALVAAGVGAAAELCGAGGTITPTENLVAENIPAIPAELAEDLKRYTEFRTASFGGWHPSKLEMLIGTRFGNTAQLHVVAAPLGMRRQLTFFDEPISSEGYDPAKGEFFIFARDRGGSEFKQLYRYDLRTGAVTLLTDGGERTQNGGVVWSNDGRWIAYGSTRRNGADRDVYVMDPRDPKTDRRVIELKGGGWFAVDWSPDHRTLLVLEYVSINESHLWLVDAETGAKTELSPRSRGGVAYGGAEFDAKGEGVFVATDEGSEFQRLAYLDLATKQPVFLTKELGGDVESFAVAEDGKRLVFRVNDSGASRVYIMDTATREYRPVNGLPVGVMGGGTWHKDSRHVAFTITSASIAGDVFVLDADTGAIARWTESELGGVVASELAEAQLIRWKSFDDREITGFLFRPAVRFTGKRPVIINIHGGPESQARPIFQGRNNYLLNELGAAMIYPNVRGSEGYGKTLLTLDNGELREDSVKDIGALLDWIEQQPDLDASRVLVMGGSYGGYMTLATAVHYGDRLRGAIDVVGISNFVTFLESTESYRRDLRRVEYGDERDPAMREHLQTISPLTNAAKIQVPLFIVQGANDPRVPRTEAVQMAETIREKGGEVWYLEAKDEGHGFAKKNNRDFQFYVQVLFTRKYLVGE
jgi:dipeptidyl aminopeptidase/acylaminoacyl peptidase